MGDMTETLAAKSDQLNAIDLVGGPITVTITEAKVTGGEQPVSIWTAELGKGRPYKPGLSMRRLIVKAWGPDSSTYAGRRMTLFNDPTVKWAGEAVGGVRISHLSHIDKPLNVVLPESQSKHKKYHVDPLPAGPPPITDDMAAEFTDRIAQAVSLAELKTIGADLTAWDLGAHQKRLKAAWSERSATLKNQPAESE